MGLGSLGIFLVVMSLAAHLHPLLLLVCQTPQLLLMSGTHHKHNSPH
jgi:hypothetical protein